MATLTPNYNLAKPEPTDRFGYNSFLPLFNDNMDKIDLIGGGSANQNIAENYDDTSTYSVGDYVIYNGLLYKCDTAVATAEAFDPTKWTHVVVTDEMGSGGSGGHTIYDEDGNALAQENGLQFTGAVSVSDDAVNGRTVVDVEGGGNYYLNTIYSTEEKKVGYWTDGKPLYQKTIEVSNITVPANGAYDVTLSNYIPDIERTIGYKVLATVGTDSYVLPSILANLMNYSWGTSLGAGVLTISRGSGGSVTADYVIILQYTKTTDTADPNPQIGNVIYLPAIYSLEERQVGVWTDGKPLYQKTCIFNPPFSSGNNTFNLDLLSDCVIKNYAFFIHDNLSSPITIGQGDEIKMINIGYASGINRAVVWIASGTLPYLSNGQLWITVQYIKTTDVAGSGDWTPSGALAVHYSTNEQVIGTWIDGKPLYERIITGNLNGASSGTFYVNYADISADAEEVIFYDGNIRYNYNLAGTDLVWLNINTSTADNNFKITTQNQLMASGTPTNRLAIFLSNATWAKMDLYRIKVQYTKTTD